MDFSQEAKPIALLGVLSAVASERHSKTHAGMRHTSRKVITQFKRGY
jgi:hypothetical protein